MRLIVAFSDRPSCYAALHSADASLLFASSPARHFCRALRLERLSGGARKADDSTSTPLSPVFVGWVGEKALSQGRLELSKTFATCLGLVEGEELDVTLPPDPPVASSVMVQPNSIDDFEVVELQAGFIEEHLLAQVAVITPGMVFPVWIHGQTVVKLKIDPADANKSQCFLLGRDTELFIESRQRRSTVPILGGSSSKVPPEEAIRTLRVLTLDEEIDMPLGRVSPKDMDSLVGSTTSGGCLVFLSAARPGFGQVGSDGPAGGDAQGPGESFPPSQLLRLETSPGTPRGHIVLGACLAKWIGVPCFSLVRIWRCRQVPVFVPHIELVPCEPMPWLAGDRSVDIRRRFEALLRRRGEMELADGAPLRLRADGLGSDPCGAIGDGTADAGAAPRLDGAGSEASDLYEGLSDIDDIYQRRTQSPICEVTDAGLGVYEVDLGLDIEEDDMLFPPVTEPSSSSRATVRADTSAADQLTPEVVTVFVRLALGASRAELMSISCPPFVRLSAAAMQLHPGELKVTVASPEGPRLARQGVASQDALGVLWRAVPGLGSPPEEDWAEVVQLVTHRPGKLDDLPLFAKPAAKLRLNLEAQLGCLPRSASEGQSLADSLLLFSPSAPGFAVPGAAAMTGSQGSGKTTLCQRILAGFASEGVMPLQVNCGKLGQPARKFKLVQDWLRRLLRLACWYSPSILLLDDLGALCPDVEPGAPNLSIAEDRSPILVELLLDLLHEVRASGSRIAIVATLPDDSAVHRMLWKLPALEHKVPLRPPYLKERPEILQILLRQKVEEGWDVDANLLAEGSLDDWGGRVDGFSVADLDRLVKRACVEATVEASAGRLRGGDGQSPAWGDRQRLSMDHVEKACQDFVPATMADQTFFTSTVRLADIGGLDVPKQELMDMLTMPTRYAVLLDRAPVRTRKGLMLVGPPGCGKTMLVQAAVNETKGLLRFLSVKGPELLSKYIGESEAGVRKVFERAAAAAPSVIFFDEIEALAPKRGADSTGVTDRVVNQMLCYLDGVEDRGRVFVIAATGRPDMVDPALMRPGRFDRILYCGIPSDLERLDMCEIFARKNDLALGTLDQRLPAESDLKAHLRQLVSQLPRLFTSADLNALFSSAKIEAVNEVLQSQQESADSSDQPSGPCAPVMTLSHLYAALATAKASVSEADERRYDKLFAAYRPGAQASGATRAAAFAPGGDTESGVGQKVALA